MWLLSSSHPSCVASGRGPVENPEIKWNKENVCECLVSVRAGTGRRSQLTSEGKDFPKSLCKTTADPAADSRTQAAAALPGLPWKPTESLPLLLLLLLCRHPIQEPSRNPQWENTHASDITLLIWSFWNVAKLKCMWTDMFVMSDTTVGRQEGFANSSTMTTREQESICLHSDMSHASLMCVHG